MSSKKAILSSSNLLKKYLFPLDKSCLNSKYIPKYRLSLINKQSNVEPFGLSVLSSKNIYIKRDDQLDLYSCGNKLRKLEFIFADLLQRDHCQHIITAGSLHSNHCKAVCLFGKMFKKEIHLLLRADQNYENHQILRGNPLFSYLLGANIYLIPKKANIQRDIEPRIRLLEEKLGGKDRCYSIPIGGSDTIGLFGYLDCFVNEIIPLIDKLNLGHIVLPVSSGGTMEGLALANFLTGNRLRIHAFAVSDHKSYFKSHFHEILKQLELDHFIDDLNTDNLIDICDSYVGLGYGQMTNEQIQFVQSAISETGIFFDPVYAGKCLWALYQEIKNQNTLRFPDDGKSILFLHTGGLLGIMNHQYTEQFLALNNDHNGPSITEWMNI